MKFISTVTLLSTAALVGCSSVSTQSTMYKPAEASRKFASAMTATSIEKSNYDYCPPQAKIQSEMKWKKLVAYANGCVSKSQWTTLEILGEKLNEVEPDAPWGAYFLSISAENRGFKERSLWMIDLALKKSPETGILRYQKGRILWTLDFFKESVDEIKKSVRADKSLKDAHVFLGQVYLRELNFSESAKSFENALMLDSRDKDSLMGISSCYIELEKGTDALAYVEKGISLYPKQIDFRLHEAYIYENITRQSEVALLKYKYLQNLASQKKLDGTIPFNIDEKIKSLEITIQKTQGKKLAQQK